MATYDYRSLGAYKELLCNLLMFSGDKSSLLMDIMMPVLDDDRFEKYENFIGGEYETYTGTGKNRKVEYVKLNGRLFDVPFIYTTMIDAVNSICMDTNIKSVNPNTKELVITLNVMCHKDNLELDSATKRKYRSLGYVGNRLDIMVALIGEILNYSKAVNIGIGTLVPLAYNPITSNYPNADYFGKNMIYTCSDFMIDYGKLSEDGA